MQQLLLLFAASSYLSVVSSSAGELLGCQALVPIPLRCGRCNCQLASSSSSSRETSASLHTCLHWLHNVVK
jgi:hypothetical protein